MKKIMRFILYITLALSLLLVGCVDGDITDPPQSSESESDVQVGGTPAPEPSNRKKVAITFDDGPHNVRTCEIVDELDKYGFTATFFVVGNRVDGGTYNGGATINYIIEHGHEVGIHGYTHLKYYDECSDAEYKDELSKTVSAIKDRVKNYNPRLMRPVGGYITDKRVQTSQYAVIMWGVDSEDYKHSYQPNSTLSEEEKAERVNMIVENVMSNVREGSIILMHDIYLSTSDAVKIILKRLDEEGYDVVSVSELLENPTPGNKYYGK